MITSELFTKFHCKPFFQIILAVIILFVTRAFAFKWKLSDNLESKKILTFSERYMFASQNGPTMLEQGDSYIEVDIHATA
jgi:hypothetical protein